MTVSSPVRAVRSYTQRLLAPPEVVLPLLCPVRECDWAVGWAPTAVWSTSGVIELDCVFITPGAPEAIWVVTRLEPAAHLVEMVKVTPGVTVCRLTIQLSPTEFGCFAEVCYRHTSLGPAGDRFVAQFTNERYRRFMQQWELELNYYLATGHKLATSDAPG
jgi:hypothetical protein